MFANRLPREEEVVKTLTFKPKILERKGLIARVKDKITAFIETFMEGMGGSVWVKRTVSAGVVPVDSNSEFADGGDC